MRNYFTQFNYQKNEVMIAVNNNAPENTLIDNGQKFTGWQIFFIFIAFTILALILMIGSWCFITRCVVQKMRQR